MKFGVVVFPGSNCDMDMVYVLETIIGQEVVKLWHKDTDLQGCEFIVFVAYFLFSLFGFFTPAADDLQQLMVLAFPIAAFVGNYLLFARKWWWYEVLFALFLLSAIYFHLSQVFGL